MKKTVIVITLFIISLISMSCQTNTGPIVTEANTEETFKSISPALGNTYLWVTITPGDLSTIKIQFGQEAAQGTGETVTFDDNNQITEISPTDKNNNTSYAFQTGTITGSLELLDSENVRISFTQNVSPYTKIMEAICEKIL